MNVRKLILFILLFIPVVLRADPAEQVDFLIGGLTDSSGDPLSGGKVYTYTAGTTSNKTTYQDLAKTTPHANPIVLDSQGKKQVYADGLFKFRIDNSADVTQYTLDNLRFGHYGGGATYAGATTGSSNAYVATLSPALTALTNGAEITFVANHNNTGSATLNVNGLGATPLYVAEATNAISNEILAGHTYTAHYQSSQSAWVITDIASFPRWQSWTPTLTPAGSMTYTSVTINSAKYFRHGRTIYWGVSFTGTVGGTPNVRIRFTLPVTAVATALMTGGGYGFDNGAFAQMMALPGSTTEMDCYRYNAANFTAGSFSCILNGFYEAAT